jgi:uncharacterized protein YbjT (DUF2867 family)
VNTITGEGLAEALAGADVVVDMSNSPLFDAEAVLTFFRTSTQNLLTAELTAGVGHHIALSVVGTDRLLESGYFRGKIAQEQLIQESSLPFTIVRATQFFEFIEGIADGATDGTTVRLAPVLIQPMAADDVADSVTEIALSQPVNGIVEIGGPDRFRLDEIVRRRLGPDDPRRVVADPGAPYFGAHLSESSLVPDHPSMLGKITYQQWVRAL